MRKFSDKNHREIETCILCSVVPPPPPPPKSRLIWNDVENVRVVQATDENMDIHTT